MSLKAQKKQVKEPSESELVEFAQLALDVFMDKRHVVVDKQGHKNAKRIKRSLKR